MSSHTILSHICEAWQPENYVPQSTPSSPFDEFLIELYVNFMYVPSPSSMAGQGRGEEPMQENDSILSPTVYKSFRHRREHLIKDSTSWSMISNMLSQVSVPYHVQPFMIGKISEAACSIASASENLSLRMLPMVVSILVVVPVDEESELCTEKESDWSCIEGLEKVRVEKDCIGNSSDNYQCVICLEEIPVGSEAVSMPCSHYYHGDCIANWLHRSSLCPLCRFQMPLSRSEQEAQ
ncbi:uncharacterized protein LOC116213586 [Punica granatum]|uniref:RING-type E3 ubiquitin transferase n=2 Tax=Punica granatum TaxID=22663 RepID=A0A2I0K3V2_PUNGR|nr:uncharacterized protein LOC116213586 [Punica granatum]PKI63227.1 hypothetical protein CRG98_016412 [Punica granatum]